MSATRVVRVIAMTTLALLSLAPAAQAQVRASELGSVKQTVDGTTITIEYSRPTARGRTPVFGRIVHFGEKWTPGANWATTLETDRDIHINGNAVPKGKYGVWMIPARDSAWTVILTTRARAFHTQRPPASDELLRFQVQPEQAAHMETLAWYFPVVAKDGATLRMHWGETVVPLRITVAPTKPATLTGEEQAPYLGAYALGLRVGPNVRDIRVVITAGAEGLEAVLTPALPGVDEKITLSPAGGRHRFHPSWFLDGKLFDVDAAIVFAFTMQDGQATGFELETIHGSFSGTATKQ